MFIQWSAVHWYRCAPTTRTFRTGTIVVRFKLVVLSTVKALGCHSYLQPRLPGTSLEACSLEKGAESKRGWLTLKEVSGVFLVIPHTLSIISPLSNLTSSRIESSELFAESTSTRFVLFTKCELFRQRHSEAFDLTCLLPSFR